jgi:hypothetical protein
MNPQGLPQVVPPTTFTVTPTPRGPLISDSLTEQVSGPVSTVTLDSPSWGKSEPATAEYPSVLS